MILLGEHAVVHGCPALAMALPRGCEARAEPASADRLILEPLGADVVLGQSADSEQSAMLQKAFATAFEDAPEDRPRFCVRAELQIPAGAGLGASAAISVAIARALDEALGRTRDDQAMIEASLRWERVFHGNPSGVDSTMAVVGGLGLYHRGQAVVSLSIPQEVVSRPCFVVAYSGHAPSTRAMVQSVADQLKADPTRVQGIFSNIEGIVIRGKDALLSGDLNGFGTLMDDNHRLLRELKLSTGQLDRMVDEAKSAGALGAKLTGGGGGGCMIAVCATSGDASRVCEALNQFDKRAFVVEDTK